VGRGPGRAGIFDFIGCGKNVLIVILSEAKNLSRFNTKD